MELAREMRMPPEFDRGPVMSRGRSAKLLAGLIVVFALFQGLAESGWQGAIKVVIVPGGLTFPLPWLAASATVPGSHSPSSAR